MEAFISLILIFVFFLSGMAVARIGLKPRKKVLNILLNISLYSLLFFMGFRIACNNEIGRLLGTIGFISILFALATIIGTIIILYILILLSRIQYRKKKQEKIVNKTNAGIKKYLMEPVKLVIFVIAGFLSGFFINPIFSLKIDFLSNWLLYVLLFFIGIQLVDKAINIKKNLISLKTFILPFGTIAGSLLGGFVLSFFIDYSWGKALSISSGVGWYSLSGIIITDMGDPILGSIGFLSNLMRESIALFIIPLIGKTSFSVIGIGVAGATSMDVSLPLIEKNCGTNYVPLSIANGAILSLLVPVLVPLFFRIG